MLIRNLEPKQKQNCAYYGGILFENLVDVIMTWIQKDLKRIQKRGYDIGLITDIIATAIKNTPFR